MDYDGNISFCGDAEPVIREIPTNGSENRMSDIGLDDQAIWATEEDYNAWNRDSDYLSGSNFDVMRSQSRSGSDPPQKRTRNTQGDSQGSEFGREPSSINRSRVIGRMFFKTKLCCKFKQGTCPYITNCNFAHAIEELRKPPPNWQEIVSAQDEDRLQSSQPREENQIPSLSSSNLGGESRSYKGRHCKKFYTEEGCPYGESCTFLHDEHSKTRESVAISLGPTFGPIYGSGNNGGNGTSQKPSNWKTRICNKWEMTGFCPFGNKCHFAHGLGELHKYGGGLVEMDDRERSATPNDSKPSGSLSRSQDGVTSLTPVARADIYSIGAPSQRSIGINQRQSSLRPLQKWKGPDKISRIYGDWIDDNE